MHSFQYHRPTSTAEAEGLAQKASESRFLAGGMSLLPALKLRLAQPSDLIDLSRIGDLKGISVTGSEVRIKAMTTHATVAASPEVRKAIPALADLAASIGDPQVRNRGTIGGSLANSDPAADYPAAVLALNATIHTSRRTIAADSYFKGLFETALAPNEVITAVSFPVPQGAAYEKFFHPASRFAVVGVFVARSASGVRVGVTGAGPCAFRATAFEQALSKNFSADALKGLRVPADGLNSDIHAAADYRAHLIGVLARRAVAAA
ncbi:MAG TPA: xanthine dehydrogenase family protein subunit M [Alphaproteobacteria bacterium]|nr:xanthine dehydrogenase family protein subunit M [Alphaproteobacteria bacterium]